METALIVAKTAEIIKTIVDLTPTVIKTVEDAKPFAQLLYETFSTGKKVTTEGLENVHAEVKRLSAELQQPLPSDIT